MLIQYLDDEVTAEDFCHGNQKKNPERKYFNQCASSREVIKKRVETTNPAKVYKTDISSIDSHPSLVPVFKPRDVKQVPFIVDTN